MSQIIDSDKPLPTCPFCDHPARIELCGESTTHPTYHVGCYNKDCMILPTIGTALLEEALSAWNTRIKTWITRPQPVSVRSPKEVLLAILANARMAERAMNAKGGREHDEYYIGMATGMRQIITLIETEAADTVKP